MVKFGPGLLVTAAFIGPGTITTATLVGAEYGFALVWALVFSLLTTLVLQEMAARLGLATRRGLAQAMADSIARPWLRWALLVLVVTAIGFGNAAYQTGNLLGAAVGAATLTGIAEPLLAGVIALLATLLLAVGGYRLIEGVLVGLVFLMSVVFIAAMLVEPPDFSAMLRGLLPWPVPGEALLPVIALVGTTVVPYNLFLHAGAVQQRWGASIPIDRALREARADLGLSVGMGGLITLAIISTAATAFFGSGVEVTGASIAGQLEPVLGRWANYLVAAGLIAAGFTSAITAPLAAAWAVCGALGWPADMKSLRFRLVWLAVMLSGAGFAIAQSKPVFAILIAQAANGVLLPLLAALLVWVMNRPTLGEYGNRAASNVLGVLVTLVALGLGIRTLAGLVA